MELFFAIFPFTGLPIVLYIVYTIVMNYANNCKAVSIAEAIHWIAELQHLPLSALLLQISDFIFEFRR